MPALAVAHGGPGGDESGACTHLDAQSDKDSSVLSKPHTHSRHGSTSSINTDLSVHSKTSSAYFMENICKYNTSVVTDRDLNPQPFDYHS